MAKNIRGFLENLFEYYILNIVVNVNFFSDLKLEYYCEYYPEILLYFLKKLLGHEIFSLWFLELQTFFSEKFVKSSTNPLLHT